MRALSFEELTAEPIVDLIDHPTRAGQVLLLFLVNDYVWVAPAVRDTDGFFLKTLYPSRKHHRLYLERKNHGKENED